MTTKSEPRRSDLRLPVTYGRQRSRPGAESAWRSADRVVALADVPRGNGNWLVETADGERWYCAAITRHHAGRISPTSTRCSATSAGPD